MKRFFLMTGVALVLASSATHADSSKRAQLAAQNRDGVTNIARTLTLVSWVGNINEALARAPGGAALGSAWNPSEAHWDKAVDELLDTVMKRFDDLKSAPEAFERLSMPYQSNLTEAEATEVLALSAGERKDLDAYVDTLTLGVKVLQHHTGMQAGSQEYKDSLARLIKTARLPEVTEIPKSKLPAKTQDDYKNSRMASVDFLITAMDGQLKLYWFDHLPAITAITTKAARAATKAK
jgi:hypothetical protein